LVGCLARSKDPKVKGARTWIGTLLVAWTFVSGAAVILASAYYQRSGNIEYLIVWLAPPFIIGCVLMALMALSATFGDSKERSVEVVNHTGTRQSIFRK
jgi:hypothetical protein